MDGWSDFAQTPIIRPARPGEEEAIRAVHEAVFPTAAEADLVDRLRADGDLVLSYVATQRGIVGHIAFSRLTIEASEPIRAVALAPLAVKTERRNSGVGSALVRAGLERLAKDGEAFALVLGDPRFYRRFGFASEAAAELATPWPGSQVMGLVLRPPLPPLEGARARYPAGFAILG